MSARSVCRGSCPCRYHSDRAISAPLSRPDARAEPERRLDGFAHRAAERDALFQLLGHGLGDELRIQLRLLNLLNIDEHFAVGPLLDFGFQLLDFRPLAPDDDAGPRGVDVDLPVSYTHLTLPTSDLV